MYPGVIIEYDDQSNVSQLPVTEVRDMPLFGAIFTSEKGPEKWTRISGKDFFESYGKTISFARHGQPLLQAAISINAGAELLCKRLVADDATLAHIGIIAKIVSGEVQGRDEDGALLYEVQKTDSTGAPLYYDTDGKETTAATDKPIMIPTTDSGAEKADDPAVNAPLMVDNGGTITYRTVFVAPEKNEKGEITNPGAKTVADAKAAIEKQIGKDEYLLYVISDNGRGTSKKRIKIVPDYKLSKTQGHSMYVLSVIEGSEEIESISFAVNPNLIINGENVSLQSMIRTYSKQLDCIAVEDGLNGYLEAFAAIMDNIDPKQGAGSEENIPYTAEEMFKYDVLFARTLKGASIDEGFYVDTSASEGDATKIDLTVNSGIELGGGTNGKLGDYPFKDDNEYNDDDTVKTLGTVRSEWIKQAKAALDGTFDTIIFNVDQYKLDAWVDANYPDDVKRAIETLADFREDFMYFRDQGIGNTDIEIIKTKTAKEAKTKFAGSYCQSYDVIDPYTKKQITVTIGYTLARLLVAHCNNGRILPTAGMKYSMIIDDAVYGTLSFAPTICPDVNQKEELEEMHVNYASYIDNQLVIESLYTSQEKDTQWSYINNVMGIQEVVKAIRTRCPIIRYTFIDGEDLERYKADVMEVIEPFSSNFKSISLEFASDTTYSANKIFYAVLKVVYNDFVQTEWFKVTALSTVEVVQA